VPADDLEASGGGFRAGGGELSACIGGSARSGIGGWVLPEKLWMLALESMRGGAGRVGRAGCGSGSKAGAGSTRRIFSQARGSSQ